MYTFSAIGTHRTIETDEPLPQDLRDRILRRLDEFDVAHPTVLFGQQAACHGRLRGRRL